MAEKSTNRWYRLENISRSDGPRIASDCIDDLRFSGFLCSCNSVDPDHYGDEFVINLTRKPSVPIVHSYGANVFSENLIRILCDQSEWSPHVGRVSYGKKNTFLSDYCSAYLEPRQCALIRSGEGALYKVCPRCHQITLVRHGKFQKLYLPKHFVKNKKVVQEFGGGEIIVCSDILDVIQQSKEIQLRGVPIEIVDSPRDGLTLPGDPDWASIDPNFIADEANDWESSW